MRLERGLNTTWTDSEASSWEEEGWGYDDPLEPFNDAYGIRKTKGEYFTNRELIALFAPDKADLPYVFEALSWPACDL